MLPIGDVVEAVVTSVEGYGIYLSAQGQRILVLIPEVSWTPRVGDCREFTKPGETLRIKILRFVEEQELFIGSIKQVFLEQNPWRDPNRFAVGTVWNGTVKNYMTGACKKEIVGHYVELEPEVMGVLWPCDAALMPLGSDVVVMITAVDVESHKIRLALQ